MTTRVIHQLPVSAKANLRSKLSAQRGRSQNRLNALQGFSLPIPAKANPAQPVLSAQRGRSQNRQLMRAVGAPPTGTSFRANSFARMRLPRHTKCHDADTAL